MLILFSFAFSNETIGCISKTFGITAVDWIDDFDCEEPNQQSEKSEKNEKLNFSEDLFLNYKNHNNKLMVGQFASGSLGHNQDINFSSSDYSQQVYSPPEQVY